MTKVEQFDPELVKQLEKSYKQKISQVQIDSVVRKKTILLIRMHTGTAQNHVSLL